MYVESGGRLLAECGGMMYLCDSIRGMDGKTICYGRITASEGYYGKYEIKAWLSNPPDRRAGMERT